MNDNVFHYKVFKDGRELRYKIKIVYDFLSPEICDKLIAFHENSPQLKNPISEGYFGGRIITEQKIPEGVPEKAMLLQAKDRVIDIIRDFYAVEKPIYYDTIQISSCPEGLSMGAHFDNRFPDESLPHPSHWRSYSAVGYLNDDYDAGEIYIGDGKYNTITIKPLKGSLVIFGSGEGYFHGVNAPIGATRYTMPSWYSLDPSRPLY